jgi:hypothetical protein
MSLLQRFCNEGSNENSRPKYNGYTIQFENYFMGKTAIYYLRNRHFKKSKGAYEKVEDLWSHLDMEVHEHPIIEGNVGLIKASRS